MKRIDPNKNWDSFSTGIDREGVQLEVLQDIREHLWGIRVLLAIVVGLCVSDLLKGVL